MPAAVTMPLVIVVYGTASIVSAGLAYALAAVKRRDGQNWAFWSFLFPPAVLALLLAGKKTPEEVHARHLGKMLRREMRDD